MTEGRADDSLQKLRSQGFLRQFWRFSRPHTIVGTSLSLVSLWFIAEGMFRPIIPDLFGSGIDSGAVSLSVLLATWLACITANIYIVGLNQLTDIPLDKINKPYLPLASEAWSVQTGQIVVWACFGVSLLITALINSHWLWWTVGLSLLLGTMYSLPPFRLKRFNFWAAFCIIAVRSILVNLVLFAHVAKWKAPLLDLPPFIWLLVFIMFAYSIAIAWFKDLPDLDGDAANGVKTMTVRLGKKKMLNSGALVLGAALLATALVPYFSGRFPDTSLFLGASHLLFLLIFIAMVSRVVLEDQKSIRTFYLSLWALFFAEYIVFAAAAWL